VQALIGPYFDETDFSPDTLAAVAVRPTAPSAPITVVLPTHSWIAYNGWPLTNFWGVDDMAPGLTPRAREPGGALQGRGGNNSAYFGMGDGVSMAHIMGWRRPNPEASPLANPYYYYPLDSQGPVSTQLLRWLSDAGYDYEVISDEDLARGRFDVNGPTKVLLFHGHAEYGGREETDAVAAFQEAGGSVIALAGNMLSWRTALGPDGVIEVRKEQQFGGEVSPEDRISAYDNEQLGWWQAIDLCDGLAPDRFRGTTNDSVGSPTCDDSVPGCFGNWRVTDATNPLWANQALAEGQAFGYDGEGRGLVGDETDDWIPSRPPPGLAAGTEVQVLARGEAFGADFPALNNAAVDAMSCADAWPGGEAFFNSVTEMRPADSDSGAIVTYTHRGGGRVLSVGGNVTPFGLGQDAVLTGLVSAALDCYIDLAACDQAGTTPGTTSSGSGTNTGNGTTGGTKPLGANGCGCQATPAPNSWLCLPLLMAVAGRRRR